ncbi:MAG: 3'-5' exonuclease [Acidobacterium ailaaui]|nr:3'-5' exonuclease [Pseudacidobacterium ailaaui]
MSRCVGVPVIPYAQIDWQRYATKTALYTQHHKKLAPGQRPVACYMRRSEPVWLYAVNEAQPVEATPTQQASLEKARAVWREQQRCEQCGRGIWYDGLRQKSRLCYWCWSAKEIERAHQDIRHWLQDELSSHTWAVLDTETTGLPEHPDFQLCDIAILDQQGTLCFSSLIRPDVPMPPEASAVHGLTDDLLATAPTFTDIWEELCYVLNRFDCFWSYNVSFDRTALIVSAQRFQLPVAQQAWFSAPWHCLMEAYASWRDPLSASPSFVKLATACRQMEVKVRPGHRAESDTRATYALLLAMAGLPLPDSSQLGDE